MGPEALAIGQVYPQIAVELLVEQLADGLEQAADVVVAGVQMWMLVMLVGDAVEQIVLSLQFSVPVL